MLVCALCWKFTLLVRVVEVSSDVSVCTVLEVTLLVRVVEVSSDVSVCTVLEVYVVSEGGGGK